MSNKSFRVIFMLLVSLCIKVSAQEMQVIHLDGKNSYVQLPSNIFDQESNATIEAWVKWEAFNKWSRVFDFGQEGNAVVVQNEKTSSKINYRIWDRGGKQHGTQAKNAVNKNTWHHLAVVCGNSGMRIYIDGILCDDDRYTGGLNQASGGNNYIGKSNWDSDKNFKGFISEFRVWNYQRSQSKIRDTMNRTLVGNEDGLIGYWRMNEIENQQISDLSASSNHADIFGNVELVSIRAISPLLVPGELEKVVEEHYKKAVELLDNSSFASATNEFQKVIGYNKDYKDASVLFEKAVRLENERIATQHYDTGLQFMSAGDYRNAYSSFKSAMHKVSNFKDSYTKAQECIEKGKYTVAIYPFGNSGNSANSALLYQTYIAELHNIKSPFVELIDQGALAQMMGAQGVNLNLVDPFSTVNAARSAGINIIVLGGVMTASVGQPVIRREGKMAYKVVEQEYWDGDKKKKKKVPISEETYYIVNGKVEVRLDVNFKVLNTQTGQIEKTEIVSFADNDNVEYASYSGDVSYLWKKTYNSYQAIGGSENRFDARKDLKNGIEIMADLSKSAGLSIAKQTMEFLDNYTPPKSMDHQEGQAITKISKEKKETADKVTLYSTYERTYDPNYESNGMKPQSFGGHVIGMVAHIYSEAKDNSTKQKMVIKVIFQKKDKYGNDKEHKLGNFYVSNLDEVRKYSDPEYYMYNGGISEKIMQFLNKHGYAKND